MKKILSLAVMLCMILSLFAVSVSAAAPTNYKTIYGGITYDISGNAGETLYYRFVPKATDTYTITISNPNNYLYMYLLDYNGTTIKYVNSYNTTSKIQYTLEADEVYYLKIYETWGDTAYTGTLSVSSWSDTVYGSPEIKPGGTADFKATKSNTIPSYAKFVSKTDGYYFFEGHTSSTSSPTIIVYDNAGTKITSSTSRLSYKFEANQTYYVSSYFAYTTGDITLSLSLWEDVAVSAQSLNVNQDYTVNLSTQGESKWFKFTAPHDNVYSFVSTGSCTPYLKHYKPTGEAGYEYTYRGENKNFAAHFEFKAGETHYFYVKHYKASDTGGFTVKMHEGGKLYFDGESEYTTIINGDAWFDSDYAIPYSAQANFTFKASGSITVDYFDYDDYDNLVKTYTGTNTLSFSINTDAYQSDVIFRVKAPSSQTVTMSYSVTADKTISEGVTYTCTATNSENPAIYAFTPSKTALYAIFVENAYDSEGERYYPKALADIKGGKWLETVTPENGDDSRIYCFLEAGRTYKIVMSNEYSSSGSVFASAKFYVSAVSGEAKPLAFGTSTLSLDAGKWTLFAADITKNGDIYAESDSSFGYVLNDYYSLDNTYLAHKTISYPVQSGDKLYMFFNNEENASAGSAVTTLIYQPETDNSTVYTSDVADLKSNHVYQNNMNKNWVYTAPEGTTYNVLTFSGFTLNYNDVLYVYDGNGKQVAKYGESNTESKVCGTPLTLPGRSFTIKLETNAVGVEYGFEVGSVENCTIEAPTSDKESGTMRPSKVTLSAPTDCKIYYRLVSDWDEGKFARYTEPVMVSEDCTLETYSKFGNLVSDVAKYKYTIDKTPLEPPTFEVQEQTDTSLKFIITAPEGTIYYKYLGTKIFSKYDNRVISLTENALEGAYVAYTKLGDLVSEPVYCEYNFKNSTSYDDMEYTLDLPIVEVTPIIGGKQIKISPADGSELYEKITDVNVAGDHMPTDCGLVGMKHTMGAWSHEEDRNGISIYIDDIDSAVSDSYYSDENLTFTITKNTLVRAGQQKTYYKEFGTWLNYSDGVMTQHVRYIPGEMPQYTATNNYSQTIYEYIEVPQAKTPSLSVKDGLVTLTANDDFSTIYYSVNGSDFAEYSGPFNVADTDLVKAYASGFGIAQSETVMHGVEVAVTSEIVSNPSTGIIPEFAITVTNTGDAVNGAQLIVASTDADKVTSTITRTVDIRKGITYVDGIAPSVASGATDPRVSVYLWKSPDTIIPLTVKNTYEIE